MYWRTQIKQITQINEIKPQNIDWKKLGQRFQCFRQHSNLSQMGAGELLNLGESAVKSLEIGNPRPSVNIIWTISNTWNISLNWLLNGVGKFHDHDPAGLLPETLIIPKGRGVRRSSHRAESEDGEFGDETLEFVLAIDKFKNSNNVPFPSLTQIYELVHALGYRKSAPARIAPLGYLLDKQRLHEELNQIEESADSEHEINISYRRKRRYKPAIWKNNTTKPCLVCFKNISPSNKDTQDTWKKRKVCSHKCRHRLISIWSDEEVRILRENYYEKGSKVRILLPAKTDSQIKHRVLREGIKVKDDLRGHGRPVLLTKEQEKIVRDHYPKMGTEICKLPEMSGINPKQIHSWCYRNKITCKRKMDFNGEYKSCIQCGNLMWPKKNDKPGGWAKRKLCSQTCRNKQISVMLSGRSAINWTDEMDDIVRKEYAAGTKLLAEKLGITKSILYKRAKRLGVHLPKGAKKYLDQPGDENIIREWYPSLGAIELKKRFFGDRPEVTPMRIRYRTEKLQINRIKNRFNFSPEDDEIIRQNYPSMGVGCEVLLTHNPKATQYRIMQRAARLGIRLLA